MSSLVRNVSTGLLLWIVCITAAFSQSSFVTYHHLDVAGSPVAASDSSGNLLWEEDYKPFGERLLNEPAGATQSQWFTGRSQDADTGLVYMGARHYDPVIGRFTGFDPIGFVESDIRSFGPYNYAFNSPYTYNDPQGEIANFLLGGLKAGVENAIIQSAEIALGVRDEFSLAELAIDAGIGAATSGLSTVKNAKRVSELAEKVAAKAAAKAKVAGESTVQANKKAGDAARDAIAARTNGTTEQNFRVAGGLRRVDVLVDGIVAIESKVGKTSLTKRVRQELARDVKLLRSGQVDKVVWEFSKSSVTGEGGPTKPLRDKLISFGIEIVEN